MSTRGASAPYAEPRDGLETMKRKAKAADFQKAHAGDLPLLEAVFGKKAVHGDRSTAAQQVDKDRARELKYIDYSKVSGYTLTPKSAKSMGG